MNYNKKNPTFLFRNRFYIQLSPHYPKTNKKSMWEVKKISRFLSTGHGILPSCGSKARETIAAKCELVLWRTSSVDWIHSIGPLKWYLAENISLQSSNCNILGLAATVAFLGFRCSSGHVLSKTKSVTPQFFCISDITNSSSLNGGIFRKKSMLENFRANVLKPIV